MCACAGYTELSTSVVTQRQSVVYTGSTQQLEYYLYQLSGDVDAINGKRKGLRCFKAVDVYPSQDLVTIEVSVCATFLFSKYM